MVVPDVCLVVSWEEEVGQRSGGGKRYNTSNACSRLFWRACSACMDDLCLQDRDVAPGDPPLWVPGSRGSGMAGVLGLASSAEVHVSASP